MMKKLIFAISILILSCSGKINASYPEKIIFKCGVIVEGHIMSQDVGKSVRFAVERTRATIPAQWASYKAEISSEYSELAPAWKKWLKETGKEGDYRDSKRKLPILDLRLCDKYEFNSLSQRARKDSITYRVISNVFDNKSHQVYSLEDGASISFIDISYKECDFRWSDIYSVEFAERDNMALNGILDVVEHKNGTIYKGQIIEKVLGDRIRIKEADGMVRSILNVDINSIRKEGLNPDVSILKQTQYLDKVNGIRGLIICQQLNYDSPYIQLLTEHGDEKRISMDKIKTIASVENKDYLLFSNYLIESDEAYFNDIKMSSFNCKYKKGGYTIGQDIIKKIPKIHLEGEKNTIDVHISNTELNRSAVFLPLQSMGWDRNFVLYFSKDDILQKAIVPQNKRVSNNNVLHMEYKVSPGYYVLFIPETKKGYFCLIK